MIRGYRPDLDGLRTVAVYLVLLFHAGLSWFAGGFIGVDLFFCLSGFLVSSVLVGELQDRGKLRIGRFYSRRVRRLLPAAVVVVVVTCGVFVLLWSVVKRASVVGDAVSALLYYANFHFLASSGDYFATNVDKSPFLHFWSLSIEEQFYGFFPLLLLLLFKLGHGVRRKVTLGVVGGLFVLSLADQLYFAASNVDRAYYGTDSRLYQLLAGAFLTLLFAQTSRRLRPWLAHLLAVVGLVGLVVVASGLVDWSPSWRGIGATVTAVLVLGGMAHGQDGPVSRLLSLKPMVYLGKISYGTYLWHWPVIVALRTLFDAPPGAVAVLAFGLATGLAALSYELLELPIRRWSRLDRFTWPVVATGLTVSALVAATLVPSVLHSTRRPALVSGPTGTATASVQNAALAKQLDAKVPQLDFTKIVKGTGQLQFCSADHVAGCRSVRGSGKTVLLVGDSQAQTFVPVFKKLAREHDFNLDLDVVAGCPWQEDLLNDKQAASGAKNCESARVGWYEKALPKLKPDVVVLLGRPRDDPKEWGDLVARRSGKKQSLHTAVWETSRDTVNKIAAISPVVVVQRLIMPETFNPADCLTSAKKVGDCVVSEQSTPSATDGFAMTLSAQNPRVHTLDLNPVFCPTAPVCSPVAHGQSVWRDDHHYSLGYAMDRREQVWQALRDTGLLG